jgi:hypothetical protein
VGAPEPRALPHQERYCLAPTFTECPIFLDWARQEAAGVLRVGRKQSSTPEAPALPVEAPGFLAGRARAGASEVVPPSVPRTADSTAGVWQPEIERREERLRQTATASARAVTLDTTPAAAEMPDRPIWDKSRRPESFPRLRPLGRPRASLPLFPTILALTVLMVALLVYPIATSQLGSLLGGRTPVPSPSPSPTEAPTPTPAPCPTPFQYTVLRGQYIKMIADRFGVDWHDVAALNDIDPPYTLWVGQKLWIPLPCPANATPSPSPSASTSPSPSPTGT